MHDSIINFPKQLSFKPEVINGPVQGEGKRIIFAGMGGSALAGSLLTLFNPARQVHVHRDYGLPLLSFDELDSSLFINSSFSGTTEETLDCLEHALAAGLRPAVIATGGALLERAKEAQLPYIEMPKNVIQPRVAVGLSVVSLATLANEAAILDELRRLSSTLDASRLESEGKRIAEALLGFTPLIYSSRVNEAVAYNWKIKINETAKVPAFSNVLSEMNHNELSGFGNTSTAPKVPFKILMIRDVNDHPRMQKRMDVMKNLLAQIGLETVELQLSGDTVVERTMRSLILADWASYHLALLYKMNPDDNPVVEEFKKKIR